jgi:hypothetical protein
VQSFIGFDPAAAIAILKTIGFGIDDSTLDIP